MNHVAWRRLAQETGESTEVLRLSAPEFPLLPLVEPWEYDGEFLRGVVDGRTIELRPAPNGDMAMSRGIFHAVTGDYYEVGAPSDLQISKWHPAPPPTNLLALPATLVALTLAAAVLTHHLQIQIFVV